MLNIWCHFNDTLENEKAENKPQAKYISKCAALPIDCQCAA